MSVFAILALLATCCPLLIFLDFHRRKNIHVAIVYVIVFVVLWKFVLFRLVDAWGLWLSGAVPFLLAAMLLVAKRIKGPRG